MRLIIRILINAVALWAATQLVDGIIWRGDLIGLLVVALIFGLVNAIVRPVLNLLSCPLMVITLGLFTFVLNAILLWLTSVVSTALGFDFRVTSLWAALVGALVVTVVSFVLSMFVRDDRKQ